MHACIHACICMHACMHGIFVESAMENAKKDRDAEMLAVVRKFLTLATGVGTKDAIISYEQYREWCSP